MRHITHTDILTLVWSYKWYVYYSHGRPHEY